MGRAVDLANLREMTDGDAQLERELFTEFMRSSEEFLVTLARSIDNAEHEQWRATAHAFKGIAFNLGAMRLGTLCKKAQEECAASADVKGLLLKQIERAYGEVKQYLGAL